MQKVEVKVAPAGMTPLLAYSLHKDGSEATTAAMVGNAWQANLPTGRYYFSLILTAPGQSAITITTTLDGASPRQVTDVLPGAPAEQISYPERWVVTVA
jgi:hypothetical protein